MVTALASSEGLIMRCLWDAQRDLTVAELVERLDTVYGKTYAVNTVSTFMTILRKKGFVSRYKIKHSYQYKPLISKEAYLKAQIGSVKEDWYAGSAYEMMAALVQTSSITKEDAEQLKELLDEYTE